MAERSLTTIWGGTGRAASSEWSTLDLVENSQHLIPLEPGPGPCLGAESLSEALETRSCRSYLELLDQPNCVKADVLVWRIQTVGKKMIDGLPIIFMEVLVGIDKRREDPRAVLGRPIGSVEPVPPGSEHAASRAVAHLTTVRNSGGTT
jgi:hypothetical protein